MLKLFRKIRRGDAPVPAVDVGPNDVMLVSYPKSGNTWCRFLIGNYLTDGGADFTNIHQIIPDVHFNPADIEGIESRPRFVKSHFPYRREYRKVVYLARDGRDVAVSYFYHQIKNGVIGASTPFTAFMQTFCSQGVPTYGTWSDHVLSWVGREGVLVVRYEDLLRDPGATMARILGFSGVEIDPGRLQQAVEASSFRRMRSLEEAQDEACPTLKDAPNKEIRFVRSGKAGSWMDMFDAESQSLFWSTSRSAMELLGYRE